MRPRAGRHFWSDHSLCLLSRRRLISKVSGSGWIDSGCVFDLPTVEREIAELEAQSAEAGFWDDARNAQAQMKRLGELRAESSTWRRLTTQLEELQVMEELAAEDEELAEELVRESVKLKEEVDQFELDSTLSGPYDSSDAILVIHSDDDAFPDLTDRERDIVHRIASGRTNDEIAGELHVSNKTVRNAVSAIYAKLHATGRADAIVKAREAGYGFD